MLFQSSAVFKWDGSKNIYHFTDDPNYGRTNAKSFFATLPVDAEDAGIRVPK